MIYYFFLAQVCVFFLFSLPAISSQYDAVVFPYTVPSLYPITNTFMTCSAYMTAAVGVNRYMDIVDFPHRLVTKRENALCMKAKWSESFVYYTTPIRQITRETLSTSTRALERRVVVLKSPGTTLATTRYTTAKRRLGRWREPPTNVTCHSIGWK